MLNEQIINPGTFMSKSNIDAMVCDLRGFLTTYTDM